MAGRRLTRKEIVQEDQIHSTINQIFRFIIDNQNMLLITLGSVVVLALAVYYWTDWRANEKARLQLAFSNAQEIFRASTGEAKPAEAGQPPESQPKYKNDNEKYTAALKAFSDLAADASGAQLGMYSRYYQALCKRGLGKTDEYLKGMEEIAGTSNFPDLAELASYSIGDHYIAQGDVAKAQPYFDKILKNDKTGLPRDSILNQMAECYERHNDKAQAKALLERLIKEYPESKLRRQAEAKLPELGSPPTK